MCEDKTCLGADGGICPDQREAWMTSPLCRGMVAWIGVGIHCRLVRGLQSAIVSAVWKLPPSPGRLPALLLPLSGECRWVWRTDLI